MSYYIHTIFFPSIISLPSTAWPGNGDDRPLEPSILSFVTYPDIPAPFYKNKYPRDLSGGMRQRAALIRTLVPKPDILLLDEPFSALDPKLRIEMQDLMDQLCEEKKLTMLLVTHQPKEIERHIDRVIEIHQGKVI